MKKNVTLRSVRSSLLNGLYALGRIALRSAIKEQGLAPVVSQLEKIVPDITGQYSGFRIDTPYLKTKVRGMHAFQVSLVGKVLSEFTSPVIVDIGDSAGTHLQYITGLYSTVMKMNCLSVNLDKEAVEKINSKGLRAIHSRAEDLAQYNINADVFLCFETLEHLMDPSRFLHDLSSKTKVKYLIITVPYLRESRVGLYQLRNTRSGPMCAENTHIFEFDSKDWKLLMAHAGWRVIHEKIYFQYPRRNILYVTKPLWKKFDFEGFYGVILKRDESWSKMYQDW